MARVDAQGALGVAIAFYRPVPLAGGREPHRRRPAGRKLLFRARQLTLIKFEPVKEFWISDENFLLVETDLITFANFENTLKIN